MNLTFKLLSLVFVFTGISQYGFAQADTSICWLLSEQKAESYYYEHIDRGQGPEQGDTLLFTIFITEDAHIERLRSWAFSFGFGFTATLVADSIRGTLPPYFVQIKKAMKFRNLNEFKAEIAAFRALRLQMHLPFCGNGGIGYKPRTDPRGTKH